MGYIFRRFSLVSFWLTYLQSTTLNKLSERYVFLVLPTFTSHLAFATCSEYARLTVIKMGSTNGILGSQVDAISTWDMPDNDLHGMVDVPLHEETSTAYGDGSRSAGSHITICGSELSRTSLYRCGASSGTYHRMCEREREALEKAERFKVDKFARDLYERLMKLKRRMEGLESEEEKGKLLITSTFNCCTELS